MPAAQFTHEVIENMKYIKMLNLWYMNFSAHQYNNETSGEPAQNC